MCIIYHYLQGLGHIPGGWFGIFFHQLFVKNNMESANDEKKHVETQRYQILLVVTPLPHATICDVPERLFASIFGPPSRR